MGYYIQCPMNTGKADYLIKNESAVEISFNEANDFFNVGLKDDKAIIVIVDNYAFEACAYAFNFDEFMAFHEAGDSRQKRYLYMDKKRVKELTKCPF